METNTQISPKNPFVYAKWIVANLSKSNIQNVDLGSRAIRKYRWLNKIPEDLKTKMQESPYIFTATLLLNGFASRQRYYEKKNWERLRNEVEKLVEKGAGHRPRKALNYPKGRAGGSLSQQRARLLEKKEIKKLEMQTESATKAAPVGFIAELAAKEILRDKLGTWVEVANGEIRIKYYNQEDLERVIEIIDGPQSDLDKLFCH